MHRWVSSLKCSAHCELMYIYLIYGLLKIVMYVFKCVGAHSIRVLGPGFITFFVSQIFDVKCLMKNRLRF